MQLGASDGTEGVACARESVAFAVDEALDLESHLDIAPAVEALTGAAFVGLELGKLRLPEAENVGFKAADACNVANLEIEAIGDRGRFRCALVRKLTGHGGGEEGHR